MKWAIGVSTIFKDGLKAWREVAIPLITVKEGV